MVIRQSFFFLLLSNFQSPNKIATSLSSFLSLKSLSLGLNPQLGPWRDTLPQNQKHFEVLTSHVIYISFGQIMNLI